MRRALLAAALVLLVPAGCGGETRSASLRPTEELEFQRARNGRERAPYMGVSCRVPNSIRCDRVGLAVWLERPAKRLTASIGGLPLELESPGQFVGGRGTVWEGYLQPAGLAGDGPLGVGTNGGGAAPVVRLTAEYADGSRATRMLPVALAPGWG